MAYARGHQGDYDRWAAAGLTGWSYAEVLPYFRRQESWKGGANFYRGGDGPLTTQMTTFSDPLVDAFAAAGRAAGYKATPDYNGAQQEGFGVWQMTVKDGRRCSAADAYLRPALGRGNLTVEVGAFVNRVVFEGKRAAGVEYVRRGETIVAHAEKEVILSGGVINSPQLLMLSGIGDPAELAAHGIAVKTALPGVGKNLQDHISASIAYARKEPGPFHRAMRFDRIVAALVSRLFSRRRHRRRSADRPARVLEIAPRCGAARRRTHLQRGAVYRNALSSAVPPSLRGRAMPAGPWCCGRKAAAASSWFPPIREQPCASGRIFLPPTTTGRRCAPAFAWSATSAARRRWPRSWRGRSRRATAPVADADLDAHIRASSITVHHPLGTCKMGIAVDPAAVVDAELRVFGIDGLRVVDGSVMPDLVGAHINAPIIMIAEKAADHIRGRQPLAAVRPAGAAAYSRQ